MSELPYYIFFIGCPYQNIKILLDIYAILVGTSKRLIVIGMLVKEEKNTLNTSELFPDLKYFEWLF